jgi:streptomycin 6-kinase
MKPIAGTLCPKRRPQVPAIAVSEATRKRAIAAGAGAWLEKLPGLVASLEAEWTITVGRALTGGSEAFVAEAELHGGAPAVLKLLMPTGEPNNEIAVLRLGAGEGCARLLRDDPARGAMLMERLGPALGTLGLPPAQCREVLCTAAMRFWRPAPGGGFMTGAEKARWLAAFVTRTWEELGRPCPERAIEYALACAARREAAHDPARAVLVHGDIHQWNTLRAGDGYKLIDPDGLLAEPEYDLGVIMREDPIDAADPLSGARWLAARTGLDATAIWEWAAVERLSTGLVCTSLGLQPTGRALLEAATHAADLDSSTRVATP